MQSRIPRLQGFVVDAESPHHRWLKFKPKLAGVGPQRNCKALARTACFALADRLFANLSCDDYSSGSRLPALARRVESALRREVEIPLAMPIPDLLCVHAPSTPAREWRRRASRRVS